MPGSTPTTDLPKHSKLFMTADAAGGVWRYCVDLAASLSEHGAEIMIATMGPRPSESQRRDLCAIPNVSLVESDYSLEWMPNPWDEVDASGKWLLSLQSSFDPDVIHLNGYAHASLPWEKPVIVTAHSCVYSWWQAVHGCAPGPEWTEYNKRVARGLAACDAITAPSAYMAGEVQRIYRVSAEKIRVIYNFTRAAASASTEKQTSILAAGRMWDGAKNLELLDRIAPELDWELRIAGQRSSSRSARFLGNLAHSELMDQMSAASMFVHPALYEPFGLSVLEAARARCCLVLSDIPSLRELWDGAAVFLNPSEPESWVRELNRLTRNYQEREMLGRFAHLHSMRYGANSSVQQYAHLYTQLIGSKAGVAA